MSDMPAVFGREERKARKEHKCCECGCPIKPGDKYQYSHGVWDGRWLSFKQCNDCCDLAEAALLSCFDPEDGPSFTGLREWFLGHSTIDFNGEELVKSFAEELEVDENQIRKVLRMGTTNVPANSTGSDLR